MGPRRKNDALELDTRKMIYEFISSTPGTHFREIHRQTGIPTGVIEYHIRYLQDREMITVRKEGRYNRYYVVGAVGAADKRVLSLLRQEIPRKIVMHLLLNPGASHGEIKEVMPVSASTLTFHLKKLLAEGIVNEEREGRSKHYHIVDEEAVSRALLVHKKSFSDSMVDGFARAWEDLHP